ncbi:MAG: Mur ligase family protein, partial [Phycisphaeraceae bacterium]
HFRGWSPHVAVVTNISPNHLDWHGSMEAYAEAKRVILDYQKPEDRAVIGPESGLARPMNPRVETARLAEDCDRSPVRLALPGRHNRLNAMLAFSACAAARAPWVSREAAFDALADFPGLPHRLQFVKAYDGVRYFNDSKCTTPEAAMLAIEAFLDGEGLEKGVGSRFSEHEAGLDESFPKNDSRPLFQEGKFPGIHLVLGGKDKGSDMTALVSLAASRCKAVYTIGALGDTIARLVDAAGEAASAGAERPGSCGGVSWPAATAEVVRCGELERAMDEIAARVKPGDVVLLSPACASWDQFENYEARGDRFIALVESHVASSATKNPTD